MSSSEAFTKSKPKQKRRRGLRFEFVAVITLLLGVLFAAIAGYLIYSAHHNLVKSANEQSTAFASLATPQIGTAYVTYENSGTVEIGRQIYAFTQLDPSVSNVSIVSTNGSVSYDSTDTGKALSSSEASSFTTVYHHASDGLYSRITTPYFDTYGQHPFAVSYTFSSASVEQVTVRETISIIIVCLLGLGISATLIYILLNRLFLRPLVRLSTAAQLISAGAYEQHIPTERNDEIGDVSGSVNDMALALQTDIKKLQEVDSMKTEFIIISSHNMRTPLTTIRGYLSIMQEEELSDENRHMLSAVGEATENLRSFVEDMLDIASLESKNEAAPLTKQPIAKVLTSAANSAAILCQQKGLNFTSQLAVVNQDVLFNERQLGIALRNLLDNAVKFTKEGGTVLFSAAATSEHVVITITDSGIGIKPEEQAKLFTKFHRGTDVMQYDYEGEGIGLYLAKLIIDQHGSTIEVTSQPGSGTTVVVSLPLAV